MAGSKVAHNRWYIALVLYNFLTFIAVLVISILHSFGSNAHTLFHSTPEQHCRKYRLDLSPAEWSWHVWWAVYGWQGAWILYSLINVFRQNFSGQDRHPHHQLHKLPLYADPYLVSPSLLGIHVIANGCHVAWRIALDRSYRGAALAASLLACLLLWVSLAISYRSLHQGWLTLLCQRRQSEAWLVRVLLHNGLALYAAWTFLTSLTQLATVLIYDGDASTLMSSTVALGVLALGMGVFILVDTVAWDRYSRYTLTPYLALVVGLLALVLPNWDLARRNPVFAFILCLLASVSLVLKLMLMITRHIRERGREG